MDSYSRAREVEQPMPKTIWKFDLLMRGRVTVAMPRGAVVLSVGVQRRAHDVEVPVVWMQCRSDAAAPIASRVFNVLVTGGSVPSEAGTFVGTFQINEGEYVGHVFDLGEKN